MKPSAAQFAVAITNMAEAIPWFPESQDAQDIIVQCLCEFIETEEQLLYVTGNAIRTMHDWKKCGGIPALYAIFCSKYPGLPGRPPTIEVAGFTPRDIEHEQILRAESEYQQKLAVWEAETPRQITDGRNAPLVSIEDGKLRKTIRRDAKAIRLPQPKPEDIRAAEEFLKQPKHARTPEEFKAELEKLERDLAAYRSQRLNTNATVL